MKAKYKLLTMVASLSLGVFTPNYASAEFLYLADSGSGSVHLHDMSSPSDAQFISGEIPFVADEFVNLSPARIVYRIGDRLVEYDLDTKQLTEIFSGSNILAIDGGPTENDLTLLLSGPSQLISATRASTSSEWVFTTEAYQLNLGSDSNVAHLPSGEYVVFDGGDVLVLDSATTAVVSNIGSFSKAKVRRAGNGGWTLVEPGYPARIRLYNDSHAEVLELYSSDYTNTLAALWSDSSPELSLLGAQTGLIGGDNPLSAGFTTSTLFQYQIGSLDYSTDLSGSDYHYRISSTDWQFYNPVTGGLHYINTISDLATRDVVVSQGNGPSFEYVKDIATGPSGEMYILDAGLKPAIYQVDPASGDRSLVAHLPFSPLALDVFPDGSFGVLHLDSVSEDVDVGGVIQEQRVSKLIVSQITSTLDPESPDVSTLASGNSNSHAADFKITSGGEIFVLTYPSRGVIMSKVVGSDIIPYTPLVSEQVMTPFTNGFDQNQTASVTYPPGASSSPDQVIAYFYAPGGYNNDLSFSGTLIFDVTAPDSSNFSQEARKYEVIYRDGVAYKLYEMAIASSSISIVAGQWTINVLDTIDTTTFTAGLAVNDLAQIRYFDKSADAQTWIYAAFPPRIVQYDEETGSATETAVGLTDSLVESDNLNRPGAFIVDSSGTTGYVSLLDEPAVVAIDLSTGDASTIVTGRPAEIDSDLLGISSPTRIRLATGLIGRGAAANQTWVLY